MSATLKWLHDNTDKVKQCTDCGALNKIRRTACYRCGQREKLPSGSWNTFESLLKSIIGFEIDRYGPDTRIKC